MKKNKQLLKQKRNRQYESIAEEMNTVGLNLSEIKIENFVESRKKEMIKFQDILSHKFSTKHGHQLLPHHMRRRQMSHNPFRIPRLYRLSNLTVNVKSKCAKHKRKLNNLKKSLIRRATKQNWLESHLWLSKRFVMKKYLNTYTIPYKRRDKGYRACYKYWEHYSIIHEMSYYDYFIINNSSKSEFLQILLKKFSIANDVKNFNKEMILYCINVYNKDGRLIGPIQFFYSGNIFIFICVSIITEEIYELLNDISKEIKIDIKFSHKFNLFFLAGQRCLDKIFSVFSESKIEINFDNKNNLINEIKKGEDGKIIIFKLKQPKSVFKLNELIYKKCINENTNATINDKLNILYTKSDLSNKKFTNDFIELFTNSSTDYLEYKDKYFKQNEKNEKNEEDIEMANTNNNIINIPNKSNNDDFFSFFDITERTTFMHRKKVDLKSLNKKLSTSTSELKKSKDNQPILTQPKKEASKYEKGKVYKKDEIKENILSSTEKETYICLIKKNLYYYDYFSSKLKINEIYYLIFPRGYSIDLIRRFVYLNNKAIGLKDLERFRTQYNQINFPKDYPGTLSYQKYILDKTKRVLVKYYRKPPSKRVNYLKILNPSPFYPCWKLLWNNNNDNIFDSVQKINIIPSIKFLSNKNYINDLINLTKNNGNYFLLNIEIISVEGGVPKYNDLLYLPNEQDIKNYLAHLKAKKLFNNLLFKENLNEKIENVDCVKEYENFKNNFKIIEKIKGENCKYGQMNKNKYFNQEILAVMKYYNNGNENSHNNILNNNLTLNLKIKLSRNLIGFVSTGLYDYSINKGKAQGFIKVNEYEKLYILQKKYELNFLPILLRSKNSLVYYLCSVFIQ